VADHGYLPRSDPLDPPSGREARRLGKGEEVTDQIIDDLNFDDEILAIMYENRPETAVVID